MVPSPPAAPAELPGRADVVVVGAGLAGLAAAQRLTAAGVDVLLLEAGSRPGGWVRTDVVDGLTLDRGFQVVNPAYPALRRVADLDALRLQPFLAGVVVALGSTRWVLGDPRRHPQLAAASVLAPVGSPLAKARLAAYALTVAHRPVADLIAGEDTTADAALRARLSDRLVDTLLRPFLAGVFLEPDLATSRRFLDLVLRSFVRGSPGVPAAGVQALPDQIAAGLPAGVLRTGVAVQAVASTGVVTDAGDVGARAVLVATDPPAAARLLPGLAVPDARSVTTWYFVAENQRSEDLAGGRPAIVVDGQARGPLVDTAVMSTVAPTYSDGGRVLVAASALGVHDGVDMERQVRAHAQILYGVDTRGWTLVRSYRIPYALPAAVPPLDVRRPVGLRDGLYVCGDHRDTPSQQGALASGRRAADAVLAGIGAVVTGAR